MVDLDKQTNLIAQAAADDLELLCRLHDHEPTAADLQALSQAPAATWFALNLDAVDAIAGHELLDQFLAESTDWTKAAETLAVEYADLYLTFAKRIAPNESYWRTEDHIERQEPMFAVREWYEHYKLKAANWRERPDDHLVSELMFVAFLLRDGREHALLDAGRFLDRHLLPWSGDFLAGMVQRADTAFYGGLALVTESALLAIREILVNLTGEPRRVQPKSIAVEQPEMDAPFLPGVQPSW